MKTGFSIFIALAAGLLAACGDSERQPPEGASGGMVAIANIHAAEAAMAVLRDGGTAIDAAVAAQAVLGLVEPQSSGPGGGAFLLYYDAASGEVLAVDGRETAPRATRPDHFLNADGTPRAFGEVVAGGQSVGVPGVMAALQSVHERHGAQPWADLFDPAIALAEEGFGISPRLRYFMDLAPWTRMMPDPRAYFTDETGELPAVGDLLRNPAYADSLRLLAEGGARVLHEGHLADAIVTAVQEAPVNPGALTHDDLRTYAPVDRELLCAPYRAYRVCAMPPPTSGGVAVLQILALLEPFDLAAMAPRGPEAVHLITQASRLAYADRALYLADPDFIAVPTRGLLNTDYLRGRGQLIDRGMDMGPAEAGDPWPGNAPPRAPDQSADVPGTSHIAIVDGAGNAISMTTTVESVFGSNVMAGGFFLNNQLTDFSYVPHAYGRPVANAPAPGKRPRSSMAPVMVFDADGNLFALLGSGGGSRIPLYVVSAVIALIDWDMPMQVALNLPHFANRNGATELESGGDLNDLAPALAALGHDVQFSVMNSGTHGIRIRDGVMDGGADPRREGVVLSD
jgi:gamma-glutamyltranspeptidase/glutathione hydrolase